MTASTATDVEAVEAALFATFGQFGRSPGGVLHDEPGLLWVQAPVPELPYNVVLRTHLSADADARIDAVVQRYRERGVEFAWMAHPTATPPDLPQRLQARGLTMVEMATGMALDLAAWRAPASAPSPIDYREVVDEDGMRAFERLMAEYWELPEPSWPYAFGVNRYAHAQRSGARWVAFRDGEPVGKVYLSHLGAPGTAAVFGMYVLPSARAFGVASRLMTLLIDRAAQTGYRRVVLHSTEMAVSLYRRLGFVQACELPVYATTSLHSVQPL